MQHVYHYNDFVNFQYIDIGQWTYTKDNVLIYVCHMCKGNRLIILHLQIY